MDAGRVQGENLGIVEGIRGSSALCLLLKVWDAHRAVGVCRPFLLIVRVLQVENSLHIASLYPLTRRAYLTETQPFGQKPEGTFEMKRGKQGQTNSAISAYGQMLPK